MQQTFVCTDRFNLDDVDMTILSERASRFWVQHHGPAVGDYIDFADGVTRRISHVWTFGDITVQTSDGGSFYLANGSLSYSGGLYHGWNNVIRPGIPIETLTLTGETREGAVWFFHHDWHTAHNGVYTTMRFAVYTCTLPSN